MHYGLWTLCIRFLVGEDAAASIEFLVNAIGELTQSYRRAHIRRRENTIRPFSPTLQLSHVLPSSPCFFAQ